MSAVVHIPEPTPRERAQDHLADALAAIDRGDIGDAIVAVSLARNALEAVEQFREARRGAA